MRERPYQKLIVWKEAHKLCLWIYQTTREFPPEEKFGLTSQMRRSAASIPTNIAEGNAKRSHKEQSYFLETSVASLEELHYQCLLAQALKYITPQEFAQVDDYIQRTGYLIGKLRSSLL